MLPLSRLHRDLVPITGLEPEGSGESAARRLDGFNVKAHLPQQGDILVRPHHRPMVAVTEVQGRALQSRRRVVAVAQELRQREHLLAQALRVFVEREQIRKLVAEHRDATGLHADDRRPARDLIPEHTHRLA